MQVTSESEFEVGEFGFRALFTALAFGALAGCSTTDTATSQDGVSPSGFAAGQVDRELRETATQARSTSLSGRTLRVRSIGDIRLRSKEVILTFDDGPVPGRTDRILNTLDRYGVKATFLMVGTMVQNSPSLARRVYRRGHAIGSHTWTHDNLARKSFGASVADIKRGEDALRRAGVRDIPFFRFPYLSDTRALRNHLAGRGVIVLDADIDSKDYRRQSPAALASSTMAKVRKRGRGIILMHDLQPRTVSALPSLLAMLNREGYKVVNLQPARGNPAFPVAAR
ncbi:MAG: polysaccharide deacetylase family protein [Pseudomonadota bacterium]